MLLSEEAKAFLINLLRRSEGRKRYMDWLFRLVRTSLLLLLFPPACMAGARALAAAARDGCRSYIFPITTATL